MEDTMINIYVMPDRQMKGSVSLRASVPDHGYEHEEFEIQELMRLMCLIDITRVSNISLDLVNCKLTDQDIKHIAATNWSAKVTEIDIRGNEQITARGWEELESSFAIERLYIDLEEFLSDDDWKIESVGILASTLVEISVWGGSHLHKTERGMNILKRLHELVPEASISAGGLDLLSSLSL